MHGDTIVRKELNLAEMKCNYDIIATTTHELMKYFGAGEVILVDSTKGSSKDRAVNDKSATSGIFILSVIQLSNKNIRNGWSWGKEHVNALRSSNENIIQYSSKNYTSIGYYDSFGNKGSVEKADTSSLGQYVRKNGWI